MVGGWLKQFSGSGFCDSVVVGGGGRKVSWFVPWFSPSSSYASVRLQWSVKTAIFFDKLAVPKAGCFNYVIRKQQLNNNVYYWSCKAQMVSINYTFILLLMFRVHLTNYLDWNFSISAFIKRSFDSTQPSVSLEIEINFEMLQY